MRTSGVIHSVRIAFLPGALCLAAAATVAAQQTPPAPASGTVVIGTVYDSLRLRPMSGATIRVDNTSLTTTADSLGRYKLAGVPAGQHAIYVEYPLLDTLGVTLHSPADTYDGGAKVVVLATPPQEGLVNALCPAAWRARGPAAFMGRVREADTGVPATGAKVSLVWYEIDIATKVQKVPRVREATVGPDGTYRICGLPPGIDGRAQVLRGAMTSGDIPISFGEDILALRSMSIAPPPSAATGVATTSADTTRPARGSARLSGKVVAKGGQPLPNARVQLVGTNRVAITRANGEFSMDSLPPGTQTVAVRLLGYQPNEAAVDLSSAKPTTVSFMLDEFVPTLATVRVTAQRERALDDIGYARRQRMGMGWYMGPDEVNQRHPLRFSDLFTSAPGLRVAQYQGHSIIQSTRDAMGGCVNIWIDGNEWQSMEPGDVDDYLQGSEVGAIEVYSSTMTPAEFTGKNGNCSTIVAWTKQRLDRRRGNSNR